MNAANLNTDPYRLGSVVMPIIKAMRVANLSWSDRQECAWAILDSIRAHQSLIDEQQNPAYQGQALGREKP